MGQIAEIIKYEGDNSTFIWKHPCEDFNSLTQLIVHESQEAIFFMNGQALDLFGSGRYTLETQNIPKVGKILNRTTGGDTPFHCEVYFINKAHQMAIRWGTDSKVQYIEPTYGFPLSIGASGEMSLRVEDTQEYIDNVCAAKDIMYICGTEIERNFASKTNITKLAAEAWKVGIAIHAGIMPLLANKDINQRTIQEYTNKIGKYDPAYTQNHNKREKIEKLRSEISELDKIISSTPTERKWNFLGIFFISTGCIMLILSMLILSNGASVGWYPIVGIGELVLGILCGRPSKEYINQNIAKVDEARRKRTEKENQIKLISSNTFDGSKPISEKTFDINKFL